MLGLTIIRNFDAISISTGVRNYWVNRKRLETAIAIVELIDCKNINSRDCCDPDSVDMLMDEYPGINLPIAQMYIEAAHLCISNKVKI